MSWIEKINTDFVIKMGDGVEFRPKWFNATKGIEFNFSEFDFINLPGTLIDRKEIRGRKFPIEIVFDGEDHLEVSERFEFSSRNKGHWEIQHPLYGTILCHPSSLAFDDTKLNTTIITGVLYETILLNDKAQTKPYPLQTIKAINIESSNVQTAKLLSIETLSVTERRNLLKSIQDTYNTIKTYITTNKASALYKSKMDRLSASITSVTYDIAEISRGLHEFSVMPYTFILDMDMRMKAIREQLAMSFNNISTLFTPKSKRMYEQETGFKMIGVAIALLENVGDFYENSFTISGAIDMLYEMLNEYFETLESLSTSYEGTPESYIPDYDLSNSIVKAISFAISALMDLLTSAKKERTIILNNDENLINLVTRIHGLDAKDVNILRFIKQNNVGLGEYLLLKKGRKILYYI